MSPAPETRSPLGALGLDDIERTLSDPAHAAALLAELDDAARILSGVVATDPRHPMLVTGIRLARQVYLQYLHGARPSSVPSQESPS